MLEEQEGMREGWEGHTAEERHAIGLGLGSEGDDGLRAWAVKMGSGQHVGDYLPLLSECTSDGLSYYE